MLVANFQPPFRTSFFALTPTAGLAWPLVDLYYFADDVSTQHHFPLLSCFQRVLLWLPFLQNTIFDLKKKKETKNWKEIIKKYFLLCWFKFKMIALVFNLASLRKKISLYWEKRLFEIKKCSIEYVKQNICWWNKICLVPRNYVFQIKKIIFAIRKILCDQKNIRLDVLSTTCLWFKSYFFLV